MAQTDSDSLCERGIDREVHLSDSRFIRWVMIGAGSLFLALGVVGIFVPLLPTTPLLLLTAACFARGSRRAYLWLMTNKLFGSYIQDWRVHRSLTVRTKATILAVLWATFIVTSLFFIPGLVLQVGIFIIPIGVTLYLATIPTRQTAGETGG